VGRVPELVVLVGLAGAEVRAAPRSAADCDALVRTAPHTLASYRCYWDLAHTGRRMEAERALEGGEGEDGLVQSREISELALGPAVVVLASCRSASGLGLRGEGVVGLGRSFFEAGAHAVVGSLSPLRDDDSSALLASLYRRLADGSSLSEAMAGARRERIEAGAPPAAWAG
jgi:hypothetical protein